MLSVIAFSQYPLPQIASEAGIKTGRSEEGTTVYHHRQPSWSSFAN